MKPSPLREIAPAIAVLIALGFAACDNIDRPLTPASIRPPSLNKSPIEIPDYRGIVIPDKRIEEIYNFILTTRNQVRDLGEKGVKEKNGGDPNLIGSMSNFRYQRAMWQRMLDIRLEWIDQSQKPEDPQHEINLLVIALRQLNREIEEYFAFFLDRGEVDPQTDARLLETMAVIAEKMNARGLTAPGLPSGSAP
jgi:hypothetical protein